MTPSRFEKNVYIDAMRDHMWDKIHTETRGMVITRACACITGELPFHRLQHTIADVLDPEHWSLFIHNIMDKPSKKSGIQLLVEGITTI